MNGMTTIPAPGRLRGRGLVETLMVLLIVGTAFAVAAPTEFAGITPDDVRKAKAANDIQRIEAALEHYRIDHYHYPSETQGLYALIRQPHSRYPIYDYPPGGYLNRLPVDPWGHPYQYRNPGRYGPVDVFTAGGTEGALEIGGWNLDSREIRLRWLMSEHSSPENRR